MKLSTGQYYASEYRMRCELLDSPLRTRRQSLYSVLTTTPLKQLHSLSKSRTCSHSTTNLSRVPDHSLQLPTATRHVELVLLFKQHGPATSSAQSTNALFKSIRLHLIQPDLIYITNGLPPPEYDAASGHHTRATSNPSMLLASSTSLR